MRGRSPREEPPHQGRWPRSRPEGFRKLAGGCPLTGGNVRLERTRKIVLPDYPEFQLIYQSDNLLSIGATRKNVQGYDIPIFDMERSVCDAIKYRNKVGVDVMAEILQTYLRRPDKNISRLMDYASKLRIRKTLNQYLEVWQ